MSQPGARRWLAVLLMTAALCPGVPAGGDAWSASGNQPQSSVQERLARIRTGLFSGTGRPDEAINELKQILAIDPQSAEAHLLLGIAYRSTGSPELTGEAVGELRQALALDQKFVPARFYLAHIYLDLGRAERAREELQAALVQSPGNPQFLALLGESERQLKNPRRSVELNKQALQADPSAAESRYYLALALFDLGQRDEAIAELERVVQTGPAVVDPYVSLGTAYAAAGRPDDALKTLGLALRIDPKRTEVRIQMARAFRLKGLLDDAEEQLRLSRPNGSTSGAASLYQHQQLEFDYEVERGLLKMQRGQLDAALAAFQRVLQMDPNHGPTNRDIAEVYLRQGSYRRALEYAARAEKLGSPLPAARMKLLREKTGASGRGGRS